MHEPPYLRRWMAERGQRSDVVARAIGMTPYTFSRRLNGEGAFHLSEAHGICTFLKEDYATLFPDNSGVDPHEIEALQFKDMVGAA